jgi:hypothetical protein
MNLQLFKALSIKDGALKTPFKKSPWRNTMVETQTLKIPRKRKLSFYLLEVASHYHGDGTGSYNNSLFAHPFKL